MKAKTKVIILSMFILISIFLVKNNITAEIVAKYDAVWKNIDINVNYNDTDIEKYLKKPDIELKYNNYIIKDAKKTIKYSDRDFTISTNKLGTYTTTLIAEFNEYDLVFFNTVKFHIKDIEPPKINKIRKLEYQVIKRGVAKPSVETNFSISDNYDNPQNINIQYNGIDEINFYKIGSYNLSIIATDSNNNSIQKSFVVEIVDKEKPIIIQKKKLIYDMNDKFNLNDYFDISDTVSENLKIEFQDGEINYFKVGKYNFSLTVTDENNNQSVLKSIFEITNKRPPELVIEGSDELVVNDINFEDKLRDKIALAVDNNSNIKPENIIIDDSNLNINKLGTYDVVYKIKKDDSIILEKKIKIKVIDNIAPEITVLKTPVVEVFSNFIDYDQIFNIKDNYDKYGELKITYTGPKKLNTLGQYSIRVIAEDKSNNVSKLSSKITIVDTTPPNMETKISEIRVLIGDTINLEKIKYIDNYDKIIQKSIEISSTYLKEIGQYDAIINAEDKSKNIKSDKVKVIVYDDISPIINLKANRVTFDVGNTQKIDYKKYIDTITDNYDKITLDNVEVVQSNVDFNKLGQYNILFKARDSSNNYSYKTLEVIIDDKIAPIVKGDDIILVNTNKFDAYSGLEVSDNYTKDYSIKYEMGQEYNPNSKNNYTGFVTYHVYDTRGNVTIFKRPIKITYKRTGIIIGIIIGSIIVIVGTNFAIIYLIKYYKNRNKQYSHN